ncbi:hypothetical protein AV530_019535 [Patagioenas fasciata monilis]|uniref:Uncharacterized protein n=1 Tax=Patagioenas fasciata monilis TaxID=372326 RepID=A0A1V4JF26_PATFA|nr:hypothetical protein AV530_019535 [Patagioenas fasciata monilis]
MKHSGNAQLGAGLARRQWIGGDRGLSCLKGELKIVTPKNKIRQKRENSTQKKPRKGTAASYKVTSVTS